MSQGTVGRIETVETGAATRQALGRVTVETPGPGFTDITEPVARWTAGTGIANGLLTLFCRHTSASLIIRRTPIRTSGATSRRRSTASPRVTRPTSTARKGRTTCRPISAPC
jgi:Uncharacterised protein family UPF0047